MHAGTRTVLVAVLALVAVPLLAHARSLVLRSQPSVNTGNVSTPTGIRVPTASLPRPTPHAIIAGPQAAGIAAVTSARENPSRSDASIVLKSEPSPHDLVRGNATGARRLTISYGPDVMVNSVSLYILGWGLDTSTKQTTIEAFVSGFGGSVYYTSIIHSGYYGSSGAPMASLNYVSYCHRIAAMTPGTTLHESDVQQLIQNCITNGGNLPASSSAIYIIVLPWDSTMCRNDGTCQCSSWCGFHSYFTYNGVKLQYAVIGEPAYCNNHGYTAATTCGPWSSPNSDALSGGEADAMVNVIAHEASVLFATRAKGAATQLS